MKQVMADNITLESLVDEYTILNKGNSVIFKFLPDQQFKLICLNFMGNESLIRIDWRDSEIVCTAWYTDGKHFCWSWGSSTTLCDKKYFEQGALVQKLAEKVSGLSYARYARRR